MIESAEEQNLRQLFSKLDFDLKKKSTKEESFKSRSKVLRP